MSDYYQQLDAPAFDYQMAPVDGIAGHTFRGPVPDLRQPYFACVGGAQAFGRFCDEPFGALLARRLQLPCLNLGLGGAGPRFALQPDVLTRLQGARFVVVQMFSGRSASNTRFDNTGDGRNYGRVLGSEQRLRFEDFLRELIARGDEALLRRTVEEQRDDYVHHCAALGRALRPPTVLLWLSRRTPEYEIDWRTPFGILSHYPQIVDRTAVTRIAEAFDHYVECPDALGLPQRLWRADAAVDGTSRAPDGVLQNVYYPTPEMHARAAERLLPVCAALCRSGGGGKAR